MTSGVQLQKLAVSLCKIYIPVKSTASGTCAGGRIELQLNPARIALQIERCSHFGLLDDLTLGALAEPPRGPNGARAREKKMRGASNRVRWARVVAGLHIFVGLHLFGCGYSQTEWDQKVRQNEELRDSLKAEQRAREKAEEDYADAVEEIDALRAQLSEHGVNLDSLHANLEAQEKALEEYERRTAQLLEIRERFELLRKKLQKLTKLGLKVDVRDNRMVIQLPGDVLFDSGSDRLKPEGEEIILKVAEVIQQDEDLRQREFQVAGHTDDREFSGGRFRDNWGLSAMRARSVLTLLTMPKEEDGGGLDPKKWSAAGYAATDPVASNETREGRSRNRRVELVIQPNVAEMLNLNSVAEGASEPSATEEHRP